jgi:hypothetical protein
MTAGGCTRFGLITQTAGKRQSPAGTDYIQNTKCMGATGEAIDSGTSLYHRGRRGLGEGLPGEGPPLRLFGGTCYLRIGGPAAGFADSPIKLVK